MLIYFVFMLRQIFNSKLNSFNLFLVEEMPSSLTRKVLQITQSENISFQTHMLASFIPKTVFFKFWRYDYPALNKSAKFQAVTYNHILPHMYICVNMDDYDQCI